VSRGDVEDVEEDSMEDRTRRILVGVGLIAGALALTATTAGAQSTGATTPTAPHSNAPFDDGPSRGGGTSAGDMSGGCHGMDPGDAGTGSANLASLT
jgi:hypothetical protein